MMRSLFSGVSGIKVHQTRMDVVGNNIANINTIGFKGSRTTFADMFSQLQSAASAPTDSRGGVNPQQIGLGVNVASIDLMFSDSSPQSTGKNTDLALTGNGLFCLKEGQEYYYTRNGSFLFDEEGHYVMSGSGYRVQGWNATPEGIINNNGASEDIFVRVGKTMEASATTQIDYGGNLDKSSKMIKSISFTKSASVTDEDAEKIITKNEEGNITSVNVDGENIVAATITYRDDTTLTVTSGYYEVGRSVPITTLATIYDSLGGRHEVTILIDKDPETIDENLTDPDAILTGKSTYVDDNGNTQIISSADITPNTDADGNTTYSYSKVYNVTPVFDDAGNVTSYTYTDDDGNAQNVNVGTEGLDTTDNTYIAGTYAATAPVYDNRWRVYIAPGVGEAGPAGDNFSNSYTRSAENGRPESDGSSTTGVMNMISYLYFNDRGAFVNNGTAQNASIVFNYGDGNGAASNQAVMDFSRLTQYANSTTSYPSTNGNTAGTLQSIAVDRSGVITGTYTNGLTHTEAQIAVAQFTNPNGLSKFGTTIYQESINSGEANIKTVEDFGMMVTASALEMSNVDLATEFAEMIITQRGFQANSKITTVSDEMLETLVNMKR